MPAGLQTFDAAGNILLDTSDRIARFLGVYFLAGGSGAGSIYHEGLLTGEPIPVFTRTNAAGQNIIQTTMQAPSYSYGGPFLHYSNPIADTRLLLFVR